MSSDQPTPNPTAAVAVFCRLPTPGKVKTRLAAGVGPDQAAAFYKLCAEHAIAEVARCPSVDGVVFCAASDDVPGVTVWLQAAGTPMPVQPQVQDTDLGCRMLAALTAAATQPVRVLEQHQQQQDKQQHKHHKHYEAAIVIGTDIPDLSAQVLAQAAAVLLGTGSSSSGSGGASENGCLPHECNGRAASDAERQQQAPPPVDMVLGPAVDGGFYLLGFRTQALLRPDVQAGGVFEGVSWSCDSVLKRTLAAAARLGLRCAPLDTLPVLQDVDTLQDAAAWVKQQQQSPTTSLAPERLVQQVHQMVLTSSSDAHQDGAG